MHINFVFYVLLLNFKILNIFILILDRITLNQMEKMYCYTIKKKVRL